MSRRGSAVSDDIGKSESGLPGALDAFSGYRKLDVRW
jgi:hypothetical protein